MVRIGLLGGVSATTGDGRPVDVGPAKCQTVLAALALSAGSAVPVSRLVELVWEQRPPRTAEKTLQWYVNRLRNALGAEVIVRAGAAYRLDVAAGAVDVARFRQRLDAGDTEGALAEWTGPPLAGLDAPGLTAAVDGLVERWLGATEAHMERQVDTDAQAAVAPLTELTARHPFREGFWALLMTALYRSGRQADALAAFHAAREQLVTHLGVEPGPRLRALESAILGHDQALLGHQRSPAGSSAGRPEGTVTFGFAEVAGATGMWARHQQRMAPVMARVDEVVRSMVQRHAGVVFAGGGERFGAAFHRAGDAVAWADALQAAMGGQTWPDGVRPRLRIGLHTGETEERGEGYFGPAVNTAARIAAAGHGDQILVSGATAGVVDRGDLRGLGSFRLDGVVAEQRILQLGDAQHPPLRTQDARRGNLPVRSSRLIGRGGDLETVGDALGRAPVVTLVGPGGVGKTRLALAAARMAEPDVADGAWLVELAELAPSGDVSRAVADALGVTERPGHTLTQAIVAFLRARAALLVLDNCEHVAEGAAGLARAVAEGCADVRVLATSRERLGVPDERLVTVAPLDPAGPGVELFSERAAAVDPAFDPSAARGEAEAICRRLDGLPLAIELAAARIRSLGPADLLARLDDHLRLLTSRRRPGAERHRTLRAAIQWSYDLLTPPEQALLEQLSVFAGTFDVAAAERVAAGEPTTGDVDELLDSLVDQSMLAAESGPFGRRFRLLETIRQFAAEHLTARDGTGPAAARHAGWCLDQVTRIRRLLTGPAELEGVARLGELWPNLRAAVGRACAAGDHVLADALVRPVVAEITLRGRHEIGDWAERILTITPPGDPDLTAFWLTWTTQRHLQSGNPEASERLARRHDAPDHPLTRYTRAYRDQQGDALWACLPEVTAELGRQGEDYLAGLMELNTAGVLLGAGRFEDVDGFASALADRYRAQGPPTLLNWTLAILGYSAMFQGDPARADRLFAESASVEVPDRTLSANKTVEARAAFRRGQRPRAFQILRSYIEEVLETGNVVAASVIGIEFINMMAAVGRRTDAARVLGYLETTGDFGALASRTIVADAASSIATVPAGTPDPEQPTDDREALAYMRDALTDLA